MAGLVPAIHVLPLGTKNVDARDKPGHDDLLFKHQEFKDQEGDALRPRRAATV